MHDPRYTIGAVDVQTSMRVKAADGVEQSRILAQSDYGIVWPYGNTGTSYVFPKTALYGSLLLLAGASFFIGRKTAKKRK